MDNFVNSMNNCVEDHWTLDSKQIYHHLADEDGDFIYGRTDVMHPC